MKIYNIDTAVSKEYYQVFIPKNVAETIEISISDGYGNSYDSTLDEGFYTARCYHNVHAIGQPKYWEIMGTATTRNDPETDDKSINAIEITDLKSLMGI